MECIWEMGSASVRDMHECLLGRRDIAYTTVMTVMSRLAEKGMLARRQDGRAYIYTPVQTRDAFCTSVVKRVMVGLVRLCGTSGTGALRREPDRGRSRRSSTCFPT